MVERSSWDVEKLGPPPDQPNNIPSEVKVRFNDRVRKRAERRREADAAAAKRTTADAELRDKLIAATGGNVIRGPGIEDVAPIKLALEVVPLDRILSSVRNKTDRRMYPGNEPATSWREPRLLKEIAESYCRTDIVPRLVDAWSKAGRAQAPTAQNLPPADQMPDDIDELRRHHDDPHAPPGPHNLPKPDAAPSAPDTAPAAVDTEPPAEPSRESILAAFARDRTPPQSAAAAARGTAASTTAPGRAGRVRDDRAGLGGAHLWVHCAERQLEHAPPWWRAWFRGLSGTAVSSEKVRPMSGTITAASRFPSFGEKHPIVVVVSPSLNADGRKAYSTRGQLFDGRQLTAAARAPQIEDLGSFAGVHDADDR